MRFSYRGVDDEGRPASGELLAESGAAATETLAAAGVTAYELSPHRDRLLYNFPRRLTGADIAAFCEQLAGFVQTGVPLRDGVAALAEDLRHPGLRAALWRVAEGLDRGEALDALLEGEKRVFPPLLATLVRAGQAGGNLPEVLHLAAAHAWRLDLLWQQLLAAVAYPLVVLGVLLAVTGKLLGFVVPQFMTMYKDMKIALPRMTEMLYSASSCAPYFGAALAILAVAATILFVYFDDLAACASARRWFLFHTPLLGRVARASYLARFCRLMQLLLKTGMPLDHAVDVVVRTGGALSPRGAETLAAELRRGGSLAAAMSLRLHLFPDLLTWTVSVCERNGSLPAGFAEMAELYERQADRDAQVLATLLPPLCVLAVGVMVATTILALIMPLITTLMCLESMG